MKMTKIMYEDTMDKFLMNNQQHHESINKVIDFNH